MGAVARISLMLFFVQFVVIMAIMIVALLMARREASTPGRGSALDPARRRWGFVIRLPSRVLRYALRRAHSIHLYNFCSSASKQRPDGQCPPLARGRPAQRCGRH